MLGCVIYSLGAENVLKRKFCIEIWKYQIIFVPLQQIFFVVIIGYGMLAERLAYFFLSKDLQISNNFRIFASSLFHSP